MIQRILTALVLIPLVLLLILRAPIWMLAIVAGSVALLAIREFLELTRKYGGEPSRCAIYVTAGFFLAVAYLVRKSPTKFGLELVSIALITVAMMSIMPFILLAIGMRRSDLGSTYPTAAAGVFALAYIALPMSLLVHIGAMDNQGGRRLIFLMIVVWSGDIVAYFVGKSMGRHKMSPRISPNKTWEGAVASILASSIFGALFYQYAIAENAHRMPLAGIVLLCIVLNIAAQLGDLVESAIKRGADVKDSGSILPGHGGMLDRIDAMLFAAPVLWLYLFWPG